MKTLSYCLWMILLTSVAYAQKPSEVLKQSRLAVELLTDTRAEGLGPFVARVIQDVRISVRGSADNGNAKAQYKDATTVMEFDVLQDGQIKGLSLVQASGNDALDKACLQALATINGFPAPPKDPSHPTLKWRVTVYYPAGPAK
jgi:TonB family protein